MRDLAEELASAGTTASGTATAALHLDVVHRLTKAALVGGLDPVVASAAAEVLIGSLLTSVTAPGGGRADAGSTHQAGAVQAQASRYLAWHHGVEVQVEGRLAAVSEVYGTL